MRSFNEIIREEQLIERFYRDQSISSILRSMYYEEEEMSFRNILDYIIKRNLVPEIHKPRLAAMILQRYHQDSLS